jgi:hypothetical protein
MRASHCALSEACCSVLFAVCCVMGRFVHTAQCVLMCSCSRRGRNEVCVWLECALWIGEAGTACGRLCCTTPYPHSLRLCLLLVGPSMLACLVHGRHFVLGGRSCQNVFASEYALAASKLLCRLPNCAWPTPSGWALSLGSDLSITELCSLLSGGCC